MHCRTLFARHIGFFAALVCSLLLAGCTSCQQRSPITVYNQTDATYYVYQSCTDTIKATPKLELFTIWVQDYEGGTYLAGLERDSLIRSPRYRLDPYDTAPLFSLRQEEDLSCADDRAWYFFIPEETMRKREWTEIVEEQLYEGKVVISEKELRESLWRVFYDG